MGVFIGIPMFPEVFVGLVGVAFLFLLTWPVGYSAGVGVKG